MQNMSMKRQHLIAAGIFIIALAVFYRDVVFYGRTFLMEFGYILDHPRRTL